MNNPSEQITPDEKAVRFRFPKSNRLRLRTLVNALFQEGKSIYDFPLRLIWRTIPRNQLEGSFRKGCPEGVENVQMMVTVPKKKRRHATDRVLMRRRIREAYRLNVLPVLNRWSRENPDICLEMAFIYLHVENLPYATIEKKMNSLSSKLLQRMEATGNNIPEHPVQ